MTDPTNPTSPAPDPAPAPSPSPLEQQIASLRATIEALPGKLRASVSDDDKRSIAEGVVGLFESHGAFIRKDGDDDEGDDKTKVDDENPVKDDPPQQKESWARRMFGAH